MESPDWRDYSNDQSRDTWSDPSNVHWTIERDMVYILYRFSGEGRQEEKEATTG